MGDGSTLIFGGWADPDTPATTVEVFDPADGQVPRAPALGVARRRAVPEDDAAAGRHRVHGRSRAEHHALRPGDRSVDRGRQPERGQPAGGQRRPALRSHEGPRLRGKPQRGDATTEIIDLSDPDRPWRLTSPMHFARKHAAAVLLPDGEVLAVGGGVTGTYGDPIKVPELFDPTSETWTTMAPQVAPRMYHSSAVLMPDGRVLSVGRITTRPTARPARSSRRPTCSEDPGPSSRPARRRSSTGPLPRPDARTCRASPRRS
jgi:hypothetical protein